MIGGQNTSRFNVGPSCGDYDESSLSTQAHAGIHTTFYYEFIRQIIRLSITPNIGEVAKSESTKKALKLEDIMSQVLRSANPEMEREIMQHSSRVPIFVKIIGEECIKRGFDLTPEHLSDICAASQLHDLGKMFIPPEVFFNKKKLSDIDYLTMQRHSVLGHDYIMNAANEAELVGDNKTAELLRLAAKIALYHHSWFDGKSGYPKLKQNEELPLAARIVAVADVFDALISERSYKEACTIEEVIEIIASLGHGTQFDPQIVNVFLSVIPQLLNAHQLESQSAAA